MCVSRPWFTWSTCPPDPRLALRLKKQETYCGTLRYLYTVSDGYAVALQLYGYNFVCVCTGWKRIGKRSTNKTSIMWMVDESECKINSSYFWGPAYCHPRDTCSKYHNATVVSSTASVTLALAHRWPSVSGMNILLIPPHFLRPCMSSRWANLHFNGCNLFPSPVSTE